jgi:hypothetical protein
MGILLQVVRMKKVVIVAPEQMLPAVVEIFHQLVDTLGNG